MNPTTDDLKPNRTVQEVEDWLLIHLAERLELTPDEIDPTEPLANYGLTSAQGLAILGRLEKWLGHRLSPTLLWNYPTVQALSKRLTD
ncbi:acyl carrier protein [Anthocerotibacter panamensis]|uniref:acyl carrier protein n=1 Tax=Anthocerotibacter panamensis TaxID=2857077 RepID=UPI001C402CF2|nr:acyl carrier protein [Anthocerotibacter panamensis]